MDVKSLLAIPREEIWVYSETLPDQFEIKYHDDVVVTNSKRTLIFNRYCWDLFIMYPDTPITSKCDINTVIEGGYFNSGSHTKLLEIIFNEICLHNNLNTYSSKEQLLKLTYQTVNNIFNGIIHRVADSVTTIDAVDFINVVNDPEIKEYQSKVSSLPESVENAYRGIRSYMNNPSRSNRFIKAYRAKSTNDNQSNQSIGPRGFVTDLDRTVFRQPIVNGFIRGMGSLYELITESRTAAKSLNATDTHIRTSEYASRRIQLLAMPITGISTVDCGSKEYMDIVVTEKYLPNLKGKWYLVPETGELDYIKGDETHLVDRVVKIRSVFHCKEHDPHKICTVCLGRISENFKENSNVGYTMAAFLMEMLTQAILSTKHLTHSVKKSAIKLEGVVEKYLYSNDSNDIFFNPEINLDTLSLILPSNKVSKLIDVLSLDHTSVALNKVGELETVGVLNEKQNPPILESINVSYKDRHSTITRDLLRHIKTTDMSSDPRGNFIIPMVGFDKSKPVFRNQLKETNIISFVNRIASMIEATKKTKLDLNDHFFTIVDSVLDQLKCNIAALEVIVYATTSYNAADNNYKLGRNTPHLNYENKSLLFRNRSISQLFVYETQKSELLKHSVAVFSNVNRSDHPLDVLFTPGSVVNYPSLKEGASTKEF